METQSRLHPPAMVVECLRFLRCDELAGAQRPNRGRAVTFVDCTLGTGGHTQALLDASPHFRVVAIDLDADAIGLVRQRLAAYQSRLTFVHGNYRDVRTHLDKLGIDQVDGLLIDAGVSLWQLDSPERGFSFRFEAPLNMAFDRTQGRTGYDLVNTLTERELVSLIREYSDERWAERIARSIVTARRRETIRTTTQLAAIIRAVIPARYRSRAQARADIDPATRTFAALRQSTNDELGSLEAAIPNAATVLAPNAVMVALTYSSNEDRIVKQQLKRMAVPKLNPRRARYASSQTTSPVLPTSSSRVLLSDRLVGSDSIEVQPCLRILTPKPVLPSREEIRANPRCRGARLRAAARA